MKLKKNPKADLNRWSNIFLLTGLALMLLISWRAVEWKFYDKSDLIGDVINVGDDLEDDIPITKQLLQPPPPPPPPAAAPEIIRVVEDEADVEETLIESTETDYLEEIIEIEDIEEVEEEEIEYVPFAVIENVPVYPGCENAGNNAAKRECMSEKVMKFVQKNFNTGLAKELGLEGRQRIFVQFKIDRFGNVVNVRARAPHPRLEKEAANIVQSLPQMTPGKQRGKAVGVLYALPILFQVEN